MQMQKTPPSLRELQHWMKWVLTDPRGVGDALADPFPSHCPYIERYTSPSESLLHWVSASPPIDKIERLDIYAEAYFLRLHESMKLDFPVTARVLGEMSFQKLVADYLKAFPSKSHNITDLGKNFPLFVGQYPDLKSAAVLETLVELEWLALETFYSSESDFLRPEKLNSLTEHGWEYAVFKVAPCVRLIQSPWPMDQFWQLRDPEIVLDHSAFEAYEQNLYFIMCRQNGEVTFEKISAPEHTMLCELRAGNSLMAAIEVTQRPLPEENLATEIMAWFNQWVSRGIIYDLTIKKDAVHT